MKKLTTFISAILLIGSINAQVLTESFEGGTIPSEWTEDTPGAWDYVTSSVAWGGMSAGTQAAQDGSIFAQRSGSVAKLITPSMDLTTISNPSLSFYYVTSGDLFGINPPLDELKIYYKTSAIGSWTLIQTYSENHLGSNDWTLVNLALPNISADYYIAFEAHNNSFSNGVHLDNVIVEGSGTSVVLVSSIEVIGFDNVSEITTALGTLQMEATILPANADDNSITWSVANETGSATIAINGLLTAESDGTVIVSATANDASGIIGIKTITISNQSVGIADIYEELLSIYPNPSNGQFTIVSGDILQIKIVDITGKTIVQTENTNIDLSDNPKGIYIAIITTSKGTKTEKLIIQ